MSKVTHEGQVIALAGVQVLGSLRNCLLRRFSPNVLDINLMRIKTMNEKIDLVDLRDFALSLGETKINIADQET
tara:strand:+ start:447 stop:668 length:222 start_codon:yes stop_codon:yes gene_type:complete